MCPQSQSGPYRPSLHRRESLQFELHSQQREKHHLAKSTGACFEEYESAGLDVVADASPATRLKLSKLWPRAVNFHGLSEMEKAEARKPHWHVVSHFPLASAAAFSVFRGGTGPLPTSAFWVRDVGTGWEQIGAFLPPFVMRKCTVRRRGI